MNIKLKNAALANYSPINLLYFGILFPLFQSLLTARGNVLNKMSIQPLRKFREINNLRS